MISKSWWPTALLPFLGKEVFRKMTHLFNRFINLPKPRKYAANNAAKSVVTLSIGSPVVEE